jgi:hypothetical protein
LAANPFKATFGRVWQKVSANQGQIGKCRMCKVLLQLRPDTRDQRRISRLSHHKAKPGEDTKDTQRALCPKHGIAGRES